jgi:hypothetical protein
MFHPLTLLRKIDRLTAADGCDFSVTTLRQVLLGGAMPTPTMVLTILIALVLVVPRPSWAVTEPVPISVGPQKSVMAESFKSGRLPAALPIPSGNPDAAIKALAGQIAAKDKNSTASLLTAMQLAGYTIRGDAGRKVVAPARGRDKTSR